MNYLLRHFHERAAAIETYPPLSPERTILFAEVGPDDELVRSSLYYREERTSRNCYPWRDGGRLVWHDGMRPWVSPDTHRTWLTARHRGSINLVSMMGNVKRVPTLKPLEGGIVLETDKGRSAHCYFCVEETNQSEKGHYCFDEGDMYWWTGPYPNY
jgi:hypothetical protein